MTEFRPSSKAIARVKNPLPVPTTCPHCAGNVRRAHHNEIYGRPYGDWPWAYLCESCDAYVGMHPQTAIPLGTLATASLRQARKVAKEPFERLWRPHHAKRTSAYEALAKHLGIEVEACHFGWFDEETCYKARDWAYAELERRGKR